MHTLALNIPKLYFLRSLQWAMLIMPTIVVFFQDHGLSLYQVYLLQALFAIVVVVLEVPTGYFADVIGRKYSLVVGSAASFIGMLVYCFSYEFWGFLGAEMLLGVGVSFVSGSDSAFLYDTLLELGKDLEYKKYEGRLGAVVNFSEGLAGIFGGILAGYSLRYPFYAETLLVGFAFLLSLTLLEPPRKKLTSNQGHFKQILEIVKFALHGDLKIKWLIIYSSIISASTLCIAWAVQPYLGLVNVPIVWYGVIWAALQFSVSISSLISHKIEQIFGESITLCSLIVLSVSGYFLLAYFRASWAIIFIFIPYIVRGVNVPIFRGQINKLIGSEIRATVLSLKSLVFRFFFVLMGPFIGWMSDSYSLGQALSISGVVFLAGGGVAIYQLRKHGVV